MRKHTVLFVLLFLLFSNNHMEAQSVTVEATMDSLQILIGEQTKIHLQVSMDAQQHAILPFYQDTIVRGVEIIDIARPDTQYLNKKQRMLISEDYTITSFDSALYYIPPMEVLVDEITYKSRPLALKVYSVPVDTLHPEMFFGPKTIMSTPFVWADWYGMIGSFFLGILLAVVLVYLIKRIRDNKPIIRKIKVEPKLPPHQIAIAKIREIKNDKTWKKRTPKEYYTEITEIIRNYIEQRFGFDAMEMTSSEIIDKLLEIQQKESIEDLKSLFTTADLVKFAKHTPLINENDANLLAAIDFINNTTPQENEEVPQPTEITVIEKRPLKIKIILLSGIIILSIVLIIILVYLGVQFYNLIV